MKKDYLVIVIDFQNRKHQLVLDDFESVITHLSIINDCFGGIKYSNVIIIDNN